MKQQRQGLTNSQRMRLALMKVYEQNPARHLQDFETYYNDRMDSMISEIEREVEPPINEFAPA